MNHNEFVEYLKSQITGSQSEYAKNLGVSAQYLGDVISKKRMPGKKILDAVGFEKTTDYHKKQS